MDYFSMGIGFVAGMITYRMFISLFGIGYAARFFKEIEKHCLMMLISVSEAVSYIQHIKYETMVQSELPENTIQLTKNIDKQNFELWKSTVIANLTSHYPKSLAPSYKTWEEALKLLNKIYDRKRT